MKAKRILSLLLTVAMMLTCVTAFAAPTGYDEYVRASESQILDSVGSPTTLDALKINKNAVVPSLDEIRADVEVVKLTDEELFELTGVADFDELEENYDDYSDWSGKAYKIKISMANIGTLYKKTLASGLNTGFGIGVFNMYLTPSDDIDFLAGYLVSDFGNIKSTCKLNSGVINIIKPDSNAPGMYPLDPNSEGVTASAISNVATFVVFANDGTTLELSNTNIQYKNYVKDEAMDTEDAAWGNVTVAYWHPETITLGEGKQETTPSISTAEPTATEAGIAVERADGTKFTYDNCYTVTVSMTNANDATKAGMQFIPKKVYENANNTWAGYAEVEFAADGLGAGERAYTAALINIPRKLAGQNIDMMARGFMVVGGETLTGTVVESVVNYKVTPEPGQN